MWTAPQEGRYRNSMRSFVLAAFVLLSACKSAPIPIAADAEPVVIAAEQELAAGNYENVRVQLTSRDLREFPKSLQPRYELTLARAYKALNQDWLAFTTVQDFADRYPHSELREQVVELIYEVGKTLTESDSGFLFFWSDRRGGRQCLEHLITRYPDAEQLAHALLILGEMAFADQKYDLAQERFRDLLTRRPDSEWRQRARFRFAMSRVASLRGPEYDLDEMQHASRELVDFLAKPPENQAFVDAARESLQRVLGWQADRYIIIANFYRTIGNRPGELASLQRAMAENLAGTPAAASAKARLQLLQANTTLPLGTIP